MFNQVSHHECARNKVFCSKCFSSANCYDALVQSEVNTFPICFNIDPCYFDSRGRGAKVRARGRVFMHEAIIRHVLSTFNDEKIRRIRSPGINYRKPTGYWHSKSRSFVTIDTGAIFESMSIPVWAFLPALLLLRSKKKYKKISKNAIAACVIIGKHSKCCSAERRKQKSFVSDTDTSDSC